MGYENPIPPVPTREKEKEMIASLKKSFQSQKNRKLYMNESVRLRKIKLSEEKNVYKFNFWRNFNRGAFFSIFPSLVIAMHFRRTAGLVPKYFYGKQYTGKIFNHDHTFRNLHILGGFAPLWFATSYYYASYFTDVENITHEYQSDDGKHDVILPYD